MIGDMAVLNGRKAVEDKGQWRYANHEVHKVTVEGPYVHGDQFIVRFTMEVTPKGQKRIHLDEVGLYTVRDGKIVEERFSWAADNRNRAFTANADQRGYRITSFLNIVAPCVTKCLLSLRSLGEGLSLLCGTGIVPTKMRSPSLLLA
jgi:hypothetical protein